MNVDPREDASLLPALGRVLTHNGWLKLTSLVFACFLFLIVRTQQVREFSKTTRVRVMTAENVVVVGNQERVVDVTVKLPESLFSRQPSDEELMGEVDLRNERMGKVRFRLSRDNFPLLDKRYSVTVLEPWLEVELDTIVKKRIAVKAVLQGLPRDGLEIERVLVSPEEVEVEGAKREVARMDSVSTSPINIENIDKNFSSLTRLLVEDSSSLRIRNDKVNVQVVVGPRKAIRVFHRVVVEGDQGRAMEVRPALVEVEIQGDESFLHTLKAHDVRAFVDAGDIGDGWQDRKIRLKIPAGTSLVRVVPDTVSVQLSR